jgi:hypothetical protein
MNNAIVRRPVSHIDARVGRIDARVQLLDEAILNKEDFEYAASTLALLLMRKIDLHYRDVHKITSKLYALDSEITRSFVDAHGTLTCSSPECARRSSEIFRRQYLDRLIENGEV